MVGRISLALAHAIPPYPRDELFTKEKYVVHAVQAASPRQVHRPDRPQRGTRSAPLVETQRFVPDANQDDVSVARVDADAHPIWEIKGVHARDEVVARHPRALDRDARRFGESVRAKERRDAKGNIREKVAMRARLLHAQRQRHREGLGHLGHDEHLLAQGEVCEHEEQDVVRQRVHRGRVRVRPPFLIRPENVACGSRRTHRRGLKRADYPNIGE